MSQIQTSRHELPFLAVGQAQKEVTHNEALVLIDALIWAAVETELSLPPASLAETDAGKCWLIGTAASGAWLGKAKQIACWTGGSWRYLLPIEGMRVWNAAMSAQIVFRDSQWHSAAPIAEPNGGLTTDNEARIAIAAILGVLRQSGILKT
jgi:Protein of unknown function (DUF2793)